MPFESVTAKVPRNNLAIIKSVLFVSLGSAALTFLCMSLFFPDLTGELWLVSGVYALFWSVLGFLSYRFLSRRRDAHYWVLDGSNLKKVGDKGFSLALSEVESIYDRVPPQWLVHEAFRERRKLLPKKCLLPQLVVLAFKNQTLLLLDVCAYQGGDKLLQQLLVGQNNKIRPSTDMSLAMKRSLNADYLNKLIAL